MARLFASKSNYIPAGTTVTLHTAPGKIHAIVATNSNASAPASLTLYDSPNASGSPLAVFFVHANTPLVLLYPPPLGIHFNQGLTAVSGSTLRAHLITEA